MPRPIGLEPVDVLGAEAVAVVDVELAVVVALGVEPVDLLAAGLDDVEVQVGLAVPEEGELGVADLDLDAADRLAPLAELGQAEAVALPAPGFLAFWPAKPALGLEMFRSSDLRVGIFAR